MKVSQSIPNRLMFFPSMSLSMNRPTASLTVLCIDDEPSLLQLEKRFLESHGYKVLTAVSGPEGLEILSAAPVDVVVLDYLMPEMDGLAVALEIRRISPEIDIIIHSGTPLQIPNRLLEIADQMVAKGEPGRLIAALQAPRNGPSSQPKLRAYPRCRVKLKAMLTLRRLEGVLTGWMEVRDLSEGGFGGEVNVQFGVEDVVSVDVVLPEIAMLLRTNAVVRHHDGFFHGLEFLRLQEPQRVMIREFCRRLYPTSFVV